MIFFIIYLIAIIRPRTKFHKTCLLVEREIANVNFAWRFENSWRCPHHFTRMMEHCFGHRRNHVFSVSTEEHKKNTRFSSGMSFLISKLTCCRGRYLAAKYVPKARTTPGRLHIPVVPIETYDPPIPNICINTC